MFGIETIETFFSKDRQKSKEGVKHNCSLQNSFQNRICNNAVEVDNTEMFISKETNLLCTKGDMHF